MWPAMTLTTISREVGITEATCRICLDDLIDKKVVYSFKAKDSGKTYYSIEEDTTNEDIKHMHKIVTKETTNAKDIYDDLEEKYDEVSKNVNGMQANIISIIAELVAIFALITVNANITFELTTKNMYDVFLGIVKINVFVVVCIIAMLGATRIFIINPLLEEKKKKKDKRG